MDELLPYSEQTHPQDLAGCETEPCPICGHPMTARLAGLAPSASPAPTARSRSPQHHPGNTTAPKLSKPHRGPAGQAGREAHADYLTTEPPTEDLDAP